MLKKIFFTAALACLLLTVTPAMAEQSPTERVQEGVAEIIKILSDPEMTLPANHEKGLSALRATAEKYISFRMAAMYSVGKPWLKMSDKVQADLVEAFTELLERTYLQRIPSYGGEHVKYVKEIKAGKKAKVFTQFVAKDKKITVEFRLANIDGTWMLYDTVAEGVSLIANYRTQFSEVLGDGTPEDLISKIRARTKELSDEALAEQETKS